MRTFENQYQTKILTDKNYNHERSIKSKVHKGSRMD